MLFNYLLGIYDFECKKYLDPYIDIWLPDGEEGRICCLKEDHLVGYTWDIQWQEFFSYKCPYFFLYYDEGQCKCIQDKTNCEGLIYNCENYYGKKSYEADLKEDE